jgi:crossover junction endodeoxyribonuclease RusA
MAKKMPPSLRIKVSLPPSINTQYSTVDGRRILSKLSRQWKREVETRIRALEIDGTLNDKDLGIFRKSYLSFFLEYYFTTPHRRDLDGGLKITLDAVCAALDLNDNRIVDLHLVKKIDPLEPRLEIVLEAVPSWEFDEQFVLLEE